MHPISSLSDYIQALKVYRGISAGKLFFRGHLDKSFKLQPKVYRDLGWRLTEKELILGLVAESPKEFDVDNLAFDKLVRAQHHGLPSPLLDVTTNPLVALYFACDQSSLDGEIVVFSIVNYKVKFFNSDTVSLKANIAFLSESERPELLVSCETMLSDPVYLRSHAVPEDRQPADFKKLVKQFNETIPMRRLLHFIRDEKPYFEARMDPDDLLGVELALPKKSNPRLAAQSGAFVVFGLYDELDPQSSAKYEIFRMAVPGNRKTILLKELEAVGIMDSIVFPELDRIAAQLAQSYRSP